MSRGLVVAGIGASAGGLGALTRLVSALPRDSGLAYIVLQHQAESQAGKLARILAPLAPVAVIDVEEGVSLAADRIYVVPPHTRATLVDGTVALQPTGSVSPRRPIDDLFSSLAERLGERAIGVVLSGTGDDGTAGLRAIRTAGGVTAVQDPSTAEHDEMPRSAIAAGVVDIVWPVERLAREIGQLRRGTGPAVTRILDQLRELAGIDFTTYKRATVERRLERQVARHHLASLDEYAAYLAERPPRRGYSTRTCSSTSPSSFATRRSSI
jgi:two-component system, chemotaxis family, CheB/CheR fusion protein